MRQDIYNLLTEEFKAMDRNQDGSVEEDEFLQYLENMHRKYSEKLTVGSQLIDMDEQAMKLSIRNLYREITDGSGYADRERFIAWYAD